jgi:large subunit ribosomal protein L31e
MAKEKKKQEKLEREFTVGLHALLGCPRPKRANKAIYLLKRFAFKHFRVGEDDVLISNKVNEFLWQKGREKVPKKISIKVVVVDKKANIFLKGEKVKAKKEEKKKEEKKEEKMTEEEKAAAAEKEKKKEDKKLAERAAEKAALKRGKE